MRLFNFHHLLLSVIAILLLLLLPSAAPDIASDRAALLALRSAVGGRVLLWNLSSPTPCSWPGVTCSPHNSAVVELRLPGMGVSGQLPPNTVSNLTNLQTLSLRYNALTGPLPPDLFSSLTSLRNLYLQHNSFDGEIPDSLFSLTSLLQVNLASNNFSGSISPSFNNLTRLSTLYLNDNDFSGPIPDLNLPSLIQFNVSNNNLTGEIPKGLSGKPKSSFAGNSLCGDPLNTCGNEKRRKKLSGGAIAGIIIGSVVGFLMIVLLLFCLCKILPRKGVIRSKEKEFENPTVEIHREKDGKSGNFTAAIGGAQDREKGEKKGLIFFGNTGWNFDLEVLLRASAEVLGKGTFGTAYKAVLEAGLALAVKRVRDVNMGEKEFRDKMEEIGRMNHENLVPLRAYYYNKDEKLLVYDYLPMGSLSALLHGNKGAGRTALNWETRTAIALGAAKAVSYLHSQGSTVSHGNIKSSNILLTKSYQPRVSDFCLAHLMGPTAPPNRVVGYRAPEVTDTHRVSQKADVYSFGVLLLELVTGKAPSHGLMNEEGFDLRIWVQSVGHEEWKAEAFDLELLRYQNVDLEEDMIRFLQLAVDCTAEYPDNRPSMAEVVDKIVELCRSIPQSPSDDIVNIMDS
ncbi:hypothetical protein BUALT_Bualt04G0036900 [Buddleja alternifolia]|uniref:Protein kinase domain-containing protein n=1 Tax=Buddleja alternifolia TaxID=168488 RepID=A0AAV6XTN4_9LAMI|nr:hypothetical protein BUALT_Bualt04G0036900 [Buddleja alternifolia]